jgi:RND family efflux transporter MFP subunit
MMRWMKLLLPLAIVLLGAAAATSMIMSRKAPDTHVREIKPPLVRTLQVKLEDVRLTVRSQGTVSPRTQSTLVPEVSGPLIFVDRAFAAGGFFESGTVLLKVDPHHYRQALVQARAAVAQTELRLAQEEAEGEVAREEWEDLGEGEVSPLTLREPQIAEARAAVEAARSAVLTAERNLDRTMIRAPYDGRVRSKHVDLGQYVTPGTQLASIYAVDFAEVRLPLPDADLAFVDLPLVYRGDEGEESRPAVTLRSEFAGQLFEWHGRIQRTEGEIDPRSRMVHVVAVVADPYGRGENPDRPPLAAGMYVEAHIVGREVADVAIVPRTAIRNRNQVLIVDDDDRLRFRDVDVLRHEDGSTLIASGLMPGERVLLSNLTTVTDGMRVRLEDDESGDARTKQ